MKSINLDDVTTFIEQEIEEFHQKRLLRLNSLKLKTVLKRKNPYLFKAKNILTAQDFVKVLLDAHLSSQEETIFGEFLEKLVIFVSGKVFYGKKSAAEGIDLEFSKDGITYIVAIKSGPNWGNSSQQSKLKRDFESAIKRLHTSQSSINVRAINGCCYGKTPKTSKPGFEKLCGQDFWELISGEPEFYMKIIEPLGHRAKEKNEAFIETYSQILNNFTGQFLTAFCHNGIIDWEKIVEFNSSSRRKVVNNG
ncbi:MAG: cytosolic protein [Anaerolineales bacterium]|nr:cytosolic protein [Anaerolineales bacterium]